jgi:hypothetical protein
LGGPALKAEGDSLERLGADFIATDALSAVKNAEARVS